MGAAPAKPNSTKASRWANLVPARLRGPAGVYAGGIALALAVAALQISAAVQTWDRAHKDAERSVANLALVTEQDVARTLQSIDLSLKTVAEMIELAPSRRLDDPALVAAMKQRLKDLPFIQTILIVDADGKTMQSTFGPPAPSTVRVDDRPYFTAQRDDASLGLYIDSPIMGRRTQLLSIPMSRRISGPDGKFGGAIAAFADPRAMAQVYAGVDVGPGGAIALIRRDGIMLARFPYRVEFIGRSVADTPLFREHLPRSPAGVTTGAQTLDRVPRYFGYRALDAFPVIVFVGIERSRILQDFLWSIWTDLGAAAAFALAIALVAFLLARAMRRQEKLLSDVRASETRFRDYAESMSDWYWETGPDHRFTYMSARPTIHGTQTKPRTGMARWEIAVDLEEEPEKWARHRETLERREPFRDFMYRSEPAKGQIVYNSVGGKPYFDENGRFLGYRGTARDVTAQVLAERAAQKARDRLSDAIDTLPGGFSLYDSDDRLVMWNTAYQARLPQGITLRPGIAFSEVMAAVSMDIVLPNPLGETSEAWVAELMRLHARPEGPIDVPRGDGGWLRIIESRTREGGVASLYLDITERKQAEQAAQNARALLADAIESLPDGFALFDAEDRFVMCNSAYRPRAMSKVELKPGLPFFELISKVVETFVFPNELGATPEAWLQERMRRHLDPGPPMEWELKDGRWLRVVEARTGDGGTVVLNIDVSRQKRTEAALRRSEAGLAAAQARAKMGSFEFDLASRTGTFSAEFYRQLRRDPALGQPTIEEYLERVHPEDRRLVSEMREQRALKGEACSVEYRSNPAFGPVRHFVATVDPIQDADGRPVALAGTVLDITERKQTEQAAQNARALLADAIDSLPDAFAILDRDDKLIHANREYVRHLEVKPKTGASTFADMLPYVAAQIVLPDELGATRDEWMAERLRRHRNPTAPFELRYKSGHWGRVVETRTRDGGTVMLRTDITAQKLAAQKADEAYGRLQDAIDSLPDAFGLFDKDDRLVVVNRAFRRPADSPQGLGATTFRDVISGIASRVVLPDSLGATPDEWVAERMRRHGDSNYSINVQYKDGHWGHVIESRTRDGGTALQRIDITEIKLREQSVERMAQQHRAVAALSQIALKIADPIELCQQAVELIAKSLSVELASALELEPDGKSLAIRAEVGWKPGLIGGRVPTGTGSLAGLTLAADKPLVVEDLARETRFTPTPMLIEHKVRSGVTVVIPGQPQPFGALGAYSTELKTFDQGQIDFMQAVAFVLSSTIERRKAERTVAQSQRLESLGQLTGGIAHDFNNLLTVIIGQSSLLADDLKEAAPQREMAQTIGVAAARAADLTSQLLSFARGQTLQVADFDANALIGEIDPLLRRSLGEHIDVRAAMGAGLPNCRADRGQLVNALINLAVNARDAMPSGGRLTIETARVRLDADYAATHSEVTPGDYLMIAVSDTGHGMPPEVLARAFEPFFTTKPVGKGTGLGLSSVYGFAKQSGGHVTAYSEPGHGTTIKLYLPVATGAELRPAPEAQAAAGAPTSGETILLVEDDAMVREFAAAQLRRLGFAVIEAHDGPAALERLRAGDPVDLLFSDVVMPGGLSGPQVAKDARKLRPGLPVLLTSGYPAGALSDQTLGGQGFEVLNKPYRMTELAGRIRAILGRK